MLNDTWFSGTESLSGVNPDWSFSGTSGEMDNEAKGEGNSYTTEFRQYDSRIGRWLSLDPLMAQFPWQSPYCAFDNNPVFFTDPTGLEAKDWIGKKGEDGKSINWEYNKDVTSADQLPEGYTEFAENGTIINTKDGYGRLGEGKFIPMSDTDYKASQGVFESGRHYRIGQYGWEECGMMFVDAVSSEMAATADFLAGQNSYQTSKEEQALWSANLMRSFIAEEQRQLVYNYQMSQSPFGLVYLMSPASAVPEIYNSVQEGSYYTAGGIAILEFTPWDDVSDLMRANKRAFNAFKSKNGAAGVNMDWHHLVEQNKVNVSRFGINAIQNSNNLIKLDRDIHHIITGHYNSSYIGPGFSRNRDYVNSLSFAQQRSYAIKLLQNNGWKP